MSRLSQIFFTILVLWFISYAVSNFVTTDFRDKIAVIPLEGTIVGSDLTGFVPSTTVKSQTLVTFIQQANTDNSVKGILLEINSPGGTVVASKEIVQAVKDSEKPIVTYIREIGTSGAYWVASASDYIVADELSMTGSIGVVSPFLEFSGLMEDYGVTYNGLKTGKYKDVGSPFKPMTDEERALLLSKMQVIHDYFVDDVVANRNLDKSVVNALANGIYYLGIDAEKSGLIDKTGSRALALNKTKELANISEATELKFEERHYLSDVLGKLSAFSFYHMGLGIGKSLQMMSLKEKNGPFVL
ncbi:MAG TPA: signal peptide peptidase SppA [Candidatus Nanoarchaeia archaeon]|nr:signal peptide peptidase SppA [Candidatus Nanoarchaeia archaeon]